MVRAGLAVFIAYGISQGLSGEGEQADPLKRFHESRTALVSILKKVVPREEVSRLPKSDPYFELNRLASLLEVTDANPKEILAKLQHQRERIRAMASSADRMLRSRLVHYTQRLEVVSVLNEMADIAETEAKRQFGTLASAAIDATKKRSARQEKISLELSASDRAELSEAKVVGAIISEEEMKARGLMPRFEVKKVDGIFHQESFLHLPTSGDVEGGGSIFVPRGDLVTHQIERLPGWSTSRKFIALPILEETKPEGVSFFDRSSKHLEIQGDLVRFDRGTYGFVPNHAIENSSQLRMKVHLSRDPLPNVKWTPFKKKKAENLWDQALRLRFDPLASAIEKQIYHSKGNRLGIPELSEAIRAASQYTFQELLIGEPRADHQLWDRYVHLADPKSRSLRLQCSQASDTLLQGILAGDEATDAWVQEGFGVSAGGHVSEADRHQRVAVRRASGIYGFDPTPPTFQAPRLQELERDEADILRLVMEEPPPAKGVVALLQTQNKYFNKKASDGSSPKWVEAVYRDLDHRLSELAAEYGWDLNPSSYLNRLYDQIFSVELERRLTPAEIEPLAQALAIKRGISVERARNFYLDEMRSSDYGKAVTKRSRQSTRPTLEGLVIDPELGRRYFEIASRYLLEQRMRTLRAGIETMDGEDSEITFLRDLRSYDPFQTEFSTAPEGGGSSLVFEEWLLEPYATHTRWVRSIEEKDASGSDLLLKRLRDRLVIRRHWKAIQQEIEYFPAHFIRIPASEAWLEPIPEWQREALLEILMGPVSAIRLPSFIHPRGDPEVPDRMPKFDRLPSRPREMSFLENRERLLEIALWALSPGASLKTIQERDARAAALNKPTPLQVKQQWDRELAQGIAWKIPEIIHGGAACDRTPKDRLMDVLKEEKEP